MTQQEGIFKHATIVGPYRYSLWRVWDSDKPHAVWIMLNPSDADHEIDDPTLRRVMDFTKREGFGGLEIVNLFGLQTPDPKVLRKSFVPIGVANDYWINSAVNADNVGKVIVAWGTGGSHDARGRQVRNRLHDMGVEMWCLGTTKQDYPRHPLYLKKSTPLVRYT